MLFALKIVWKLVKLFVRAVRKFVELSLFPLTFLLGRLRDGSGGDDDATPEAAATGRAPGDAAERREPTATAPADAAERGESTAATAPGSDGPARPGGEPAGPADSSLGEGDAAAAAGATATAVSGAAADSPRRSEAEGAYRSFRRALFLYAGWVVADTVVWFVVLSTQFGVGFADVRSGMLLLSVGLGAAVPAGLGVLARRRTTAVWGVTFGLAAFTLLTSVVGLLGVHLFGPFGNGAALFEQLNSMPLVALSRLVGVGLLARVTYYGWEGRGAAGVDVGADPGGAAPGPSAGTPQATGASTGGASPTEASPPADAPRDASGVATPTAGAETDGAPTAEADGPAPAAGDAPTAASEPPAETPSDGAASAPSADAAPATDDGDVDADAAGVAPADADATASDGDDAAPDAAGTDAPDRADDAVAAALADLDADDPTPDSVRELGDAVATAGMTDDAASALSSLAAADDPAVRMAVCAVCRQLSDDRAEDVLRRLRIDTDDEVSEAAIAALRGR